MRCAALVFTGCSNKEKEEQLRQAQAVAEASREELADAVSDRDQLLGLVNEISSSMEQIKQLENILTVSGGSETPGQREQIRADIAAIQETLVQRPPPARRPREETVESNLNNGKLQQTHHIAAHTARRPGPGNCIVAHKPRRSTDEDWIILMHKLTRSIPLSIL